MSVKIDEFYTEQPEAFRFDNPGDTIDGDIVETQLIDDQYNVGGKPVLVLTIATNDGDRKLFVRGQMSRAVGEAVKSAGANGIDEGSTVRVTFTGTRELNGGRTMKLYEAEYVPPQPIGSAVLSDVEAAWNGVSA